MKNSTKWSIDHAHSEVAFKVKHLMISNVKGGTIKDHWGNERVGLSLSGKINRKDWGLIWNTALDEGGLMLSDEIRINCDVELLKQN